MFHFGRCGQQHSYCVQQGCTLEAGANIGSCIFPDGSSRSELDFFQGRCGPGNPTDHVEDRDHLITAKVARRSHRYLEQESRSWAGSARRIVCRRARSSMII